LNPLGKIYLDTPELWGMRELKSQKIYQRKKVIENST